MEVEGGRRVGVGEAVTVGVWVGVIVGVGLRVVVEVAVRIGLGVIEPSEAIAGAVGGCGFKAIVPMIRIPATPTRTIVIMANIFNQNRHRCHFCNASTKLL